MLYVVCCMLYVICWMLYVEKVKNHKIEHKGTAFFGNVQKKL